MPAGRPKKKIDYEAVEKLAGIMCTQEEIASYLDVSVRTLQRDEEFCRIYKKGMDKGKMSLRRLQYKAAESGNNTMLVWLGKQYLGQNDKVSTEITGKDGGPVQYDSPRTEIESRIDGIIKRTGTAADTSKIQ